VCVRSLCGGAELRVASSLRYFDIRLLTSLDDPDSNVSEGMASSSRLRPRSRGVWVAQRFFVACHPPRWAHPLRLALHFFLGRLPSLALPLANEVHASIMPVWHLD